MLFCGPDKLSEQPLSTMFGINEDAREDPASSVIGCPQEPLGLCKGGNGAPADRQITPVGEQPNRLACTDAAAKIGVVRVGGESTLTRGAPWATCTSTTSSQATPERGAQGPDTARDHDADEESLGIAGGVIEHDRSSLPLASSKSRSDARDDGEDVAVRVAEEGHPLLHSGVAQCAVVGVDEVRFAVEGDSADL